jgi:putative ATP-binding cassette transporter
MIKHKGLWFLLALVLVDCGIGAGVLVWREGFWSAVSVRDQSTFWTYIGYFIVMALVSCYVYGKSQFLQNKIALDIRSKLTSKALKMARYGTIEGGAQRVQEDCLVYPTLFLQLLSGVVRSVVMIASFTVILLLTLPVKYLIIPVLYIVAGTWVASTIAKPLINLNFINQVKEAAFRALLSKKSKMEHRLELYNEVYQNNFNLFIKTKHLNYFQTFYNQVTIIIPYLLLASLYFSAIISFGVLMQVSSGMIEMINQASYLINSFSDINKLLASRKRLKEIEII